MKSSRLYELVGSPIDRIKTGKLERAAQFGLSYENEESFECNQSFPRALQPPSKLKHQNDLTTIDLNTMKSLNSVSFLKQNLIKNHNSSLTNKRNYLNNTTLNLRGDTSYLANNSNISQSIAAFDKSWAFYNQFVNTNAMISNLNLNSENEAASVGAISNPNKALVVINGRTTEILTANNISCELFGYSETKLIGAKLKDLLDLNGHSNETKAEDLLMESNRLDENGRIVLCSGKIFDAFTVDTNNPAARTTNEEESSRAVIPISIYMLKLTDEAEPKCLCVMEPVQRISGTFAFNVKGRIKYYNSNFSNIFGYTNINETNKQLAAENTNPSSLSALTSSKLLVGKEITDLIPHIKLPMGAILPEISKQTLTGRSLTGENIPLKVTITTKQLYNEEIVYNCTVSVYTNISGLVTVNPVTYQINSCNGTFSRLVFGYDEKELINKPITHLIPNFFEAEASTTVTTEKINKTRTPLCTNNSYLNLPTTDKSKNYSYHKLNKTNNQNGSFLDVKSGTNTISRTTQTAPAVVVSQANDANELKRACTSCGSKMSTEQVKPTNLVEAFNLSSMDYSPNRKCAKFIETNTFSYQSPKASQQQELLMHSSAKKSLLHKAISNNALLNSEKAANISLEDLSILSSTSTSQCSSLTGSPSKQACSLSHVNVSELDDDYENILNKSFLCDDCWLKNKNSHSDSNKKQTSNEDVSLLVLETNEDAKQDAYNKSKRKVRLSAENEMEQTTNECDEPRRASLTSEKSKKFKNQVTSTPAAQQMLSSVKKQLMAANKSASFMHNYNDGLYFGSGRHSDGSLIKIFYQRKHVSLSSDDAEEERMECDQDNIISNKNLICIWISRDPYSDKSMLDYSLDQSQLFARNAKKLNQTQSENTGYLSEYEDLTTLGRGASGFVQLAKRKVDKFDVVTKYILKTKIYKENWIEDERYPYGKIPLECSILCKLDHENIIKVLEIFQDEEHVQMVMEKHGCGMDLFEFIDRQRHFIEEPLASHIFKQIVSAVAYLHSNSLVHRDIKDENIVINQGFHIKLIDFGSAAYITKGKKFATFCGTLDYCSPDVLLGNKYYGPELDIWTCGIVLYTLIFSENPFLDAEETIECILKPPFRVSKELMKLLFSILCPKPELRASIEEIQANDWVNQSVDMNNYKWEEVVRDTEFNGNNAGDSNRDELLQKQQQQQQQQHQQHHNVINQLVDEHGEEEFINENKQDFQFMNENHHQSQTFNERKFEILSKSF